MFYTHHQQHDIHCYTYNAIYYKRVLHCFHYSSLIHWLEQEDRNKMILKIGMEFVNTKFSYIRKSSMNKPTFLTYWIPCCPVTTSLTCSSVGTHQIVATSTGVFNSVSNIISDIATRDEAICRNWWTGTFIWELNFAINFMKYNGLIAKYTYTQSQIVIN